MPNAAPLRVTGIRKTDLVRYYDEFAEFALPYLRDRPLSLVRAPSSIQGELLLPKAWGANPHHAATGGRSLRATSRYWSRTRTNSSSDCRRCRSSLGQSVTVCTPGQMSSMASRYESNRRALISRRGATMPTIEVGARDAYGCTPQFQIGAQLWLPHA